MRPRNTERWRTIEARLSRESTIWLSTVRRDGRPHMVPLWYVWVDGRIYFCTGSTSQKFTNMIGNQNVALALPDAVNVIIIEGEAHTTTRATMDSLAEHFFHKYEWDYRYDDSADWRLVEVTPFKMLVWGDGYDQQDGTRVL